MTAHLAGLGVSAFGVDLSPKMIGLARQAYPNLRFTEGSMTALEMRGDELGGILAWYSTHHTPPQWLPAVFAEFHRTLAPGGYLLWGDYVGDERLQPTQGYGRPVSYESHLPAGPRPVDDAGDPDACRPWGLPVEQHVAGLEVPVRRLAAAHHARHARPGLPGCRRRRCHPQPAHRS
ncbi:Methyltransferase domain-containing protein [Streptomyces melanosporofaciens]|uniref:Methyltransferase domain-containing protein n=1 Tax=Streptomyces melanosporofaciens TaxID=67327 RepID=A0A1H4IAE7_STRMJ|nr:Methyltransferase domain-containing protein [Streptomyces melanosporofaciens]